MIQDYSWEIYLPVLKKIEAFIIKNKYKKIVEIGPGTRPFLFATDYIDKYDKQFDLIDSQTYLKLDVSKEKLPYKDKEVDFLYARHILEDLYNPTEILFEIERVSKSGYLETPSPIAEISRQIANPSAPFFRGYPHHRSIIWSFNNVLNILPKYSQIEYFLFDDIFLHNILNQDKLYWNTYFFWNDKIKFIEHNLDFNMSMNKYYPLILQSLDQSIKDNNQLLL